MFSFNRIFRTFETSSRKYSRSRKLKKVLVFYSLIRTFAPEFKEPELMRLFFSLILSLMVALTTVAQKPLHVVMLGDSNTWIGGDDCDKPLGWNKWFKDALQPTTCKSYARSGATWTNTPQTHRDTKENIEILGNNNVIYNQICRLQEAVEGGDQAIPQLILIMAGTNDAWFQKQRPKALAMCACQAFNTDKSSTHSFITFGERFLFRKTRFTIFKTFSTVSSSIFLTKSG